MAKTTLMKEITDLMITRTFTSPRELVWKVWTEPEYVKRWWGPEGFTSPFVRIDFRVGGKYLYCMRSPEGQDYWSTGVYQEIIPGKKIVATDNFADEKGNVVPASHYGMSGDWSRDLTVTVTFEERDGWTTLTLLHSGIPAGGIRDLTKAGWNESFDKLASVLDNEMLTTTKTLLIAEPGKQEVSIMRIFDAPREGVWKAYTDPKLIAHWWGPGIYSTIVDRMDVKVGGIWRFVNRDSEGNEFAFHGVYHEVSKPSRLVYTFEWEGMPGHVLLGIVTFEEMDDKTKLMEKSVFESVADRDGMFKSGMSEGAAETMDRLAEIVEKKRSKKGTDM
jgi:uncharacterized protein YndB with AHSA1/START domain